MKTQETFSCTRNLLRKNELKKMISLEQDILQVFKFNTSRNIFLQQRKKLLQQDSAMFVAGSETRTVKELEKRQEHIVKTVMLVFVQYLASKYTTIREI